MSNTLWILGNLAIFMMMSFITTIKLTKQAHYVVVVVKKQINNFFSQVKRKIIFN